jgi:hypothetical protein
MNKNLTYENILEEVEDFTKYTVYVMKRLDDHKEFKSAQQLNTLQGYENYLIKHPDGLHNWEAKQKIDEFIAIKKAKELEEQRQKEAEEQRKREQKELEESVRLENIANDHKTFDQARKTDTKQAYEGYLVKYPNGLHKAEATNSISYFLRQEAIDDDHKAFEKTKKIDTQKEYENYLLKYPKGLHKEEARQKIDAFKAITKAKELEEQKKREEEKQEIQRQKEAEEQTKREQKEQEAQRQKELKEQEDDRSSLFKTVGGLLMVVVVIWMLSPTKRIEEPPAEPITTVPVEPSITVETVDTTIEQEINATPFYKPSRSVCESRGGEWDTEYDECKAEWNTAMDICQLPTREQWEPELKECGVKLDSNGYAFGYLDKKRGQECAKQKGLAALSYWSSTDEGSSDNVLGVFFGRGFHDWGDKTYSSPFRCVQGGQ